MRAIVLPSFEEITQFFVKSLGTALDAYSVTNDTLSLSVVVEAEPKKTRVFEFSKQELVAASELISEFSLDGLKLYNDKYFETPVIRISQGYTSVLYRGIQVSDESTGTSFELGGISDAYFWIYLREMVSKEGRIFILHNISSLDWELERYTGASIIGLLRQTVGLSNIRIKTNNKTSLAKFGEIATSLSYIMAFHLKASFRILIEIGGNQEKSLSLPKRISDVEDIQFPRLKYDSNLTNYYSKMVSSSDVSSQFLSLYHILEHEFDRIITEDTIKYVSDYVKSTAFSYKDYGSIENLIKEIVKRVKFSQDDDDDITAGKELNALRLVVAKFIKNRAELSKMLGRDLIKYYTEHDVQFCGAKRIDLSKDDDTIFAEIAQRIYTVRNSIVHSKSKNSSRFVPFRDETSLSRELPLIQVISEQIIESSATDLS